VSYTKGTYVLQDQTVEIPLRSGSLDLYPFDKYSTNMVVVLLNDIGTVQNFSIIVSGRRLYGFDYGASRHRGSGFAEELYTYSVIITRSGSFLVYPIFQMIAFWALGLWMALFALVVGIFKMKKAEPAVVSFTLSLLFALPAFRNTAPLSPPFGCTLDICSFYWAMLLVLCVFFGMSVRYLQQAPPLVPPGHSGVESINGDQK